MSRLLALLSLAAGVCVFVATSANGGSSDRGYPNSIVVIGHSGATGYNSDPRLPHGDTLANSWATGTNPAVNSVYLRILAANPAIKGHNTNLAQDGSKVRQLVDQAKRAVALKPAPELILIQTIDNDIVCPARASDYTAFRATFITALDAIAKGAPDARIFATSQFGRPATYGRALLRAVPKAAGRLEGNGPCDLLNKAGKWVPKHVSLLTSVIRGYEAQVAAGCKQFVKCSYDGGAFAHVVDQFAYMSRDWNHFSVRGHAKAAATAWAAMKRAGVIPK